MAVGPFIRYAPPSESGTTWAFKGPDPNMVPDPGRRNRRHQFKDGECAQCGCRFNTIFGHDPSREQLEAWGLGLTCEEAVTNSVMGV